MLLLLTLTLSQLPAQNNTKITVKSVASTSWTTKVPETKVTTSNHKVAGTALGAGVGYWLIGGLIGLIAGAIS